MRSLFHTDSTDVHGFLFHANLAKNAKLCPMNLSHTDLTNLTEASRFALAAIRLETFGKADRLRRRGMKASVATTRTLVLPRSAMQPISWFP